MYFYFSLLDIPQYTWIPNGFSLGKKPTLMGAQFLIVSSMKECVMYFGEVYNMGLIELQHNWLWMPFPFVSQKKICDKTTIRELNTFISTLPAQTKNYAWFEGNSEIYSKWKNLKDHSIIVALLLLLYAGFGIGQGLSRIPEKFFHICPKRPPQGKPL